MHLSVPLVLRYTSTHHGLLRHSKFAHRWNLGPIVPERRPKRSEIDSLRLTSEPCLLRHSASTVRHTSLSHLVQEVWTLVAGADRLHAGLLQRPTARPPHHAARREFRWTPPTWARAQGGDATPPQGGARPGAIPGDGTQRAASAAAAGATAAGAASARPTAAVVLRSSGKTGAPFSHF